jgi:hypothetical protein
VAGEPFGSNLHGPASVGGEAKRHGSIVVAPKLICKLVVETTGAVALNG